MASRAPALAAPRPPDRKKTRQRSQREEGRGKSQGLAKLFPERRKDVPPPLPSTPPPPPYPGREVGPVREDHPGRLLVREGHILPLPTRRSFRLAGRGPDSHGQLPLWVEERNGITRPVSEWDMTGAQTDTTFDSRWESLRVKNHLIHSSAGGERPPGWEDITSQGKNKSHFKEENGIPSNFVSLDPWWVKKEDDNKHNHQISAPKSQNNLPPHVLHSQVSTPSMSTTQASTSQVVSFHTPIPHPQSFPHSTASTFIRQDHIRTTQPCIESSPLKYKPSPPNFIPTVGSQHPSCFTPDPAISPPDTQGCGAAIQISSQMSSTSPSSGPPKSPSFRSFSLPNSPSLAQTSRKFTEKGTPLNLTSFSTSLDDLFPSSSLKHPKRSNSTSILALNSASSTPTIDDRHLWSSSDSFFCENFRFNDYVDKDDLWTRNLSTCPRSYSQILLQQRLRDKQKETDMSSQEVSFDPEEENRLSDEEALQLGEVVTQEATGELPAEENFRIPPPPPRHRKSVNNNDRYIKTIQNAKPPPGSRDDPTRCHQWEQFDLGSIENVDRQAGGKERAPMTPAFACKQESQPPPTQDVRLYQPLSVQHVAQSSTGNLSRLKINTSSPTFGRQLIRTYSQRGRRASKKVINSVSRKMASKEYGRLQESVAPMYSRAVLTMQSGPGLFEQSPPVEDVEQATEAVESVGVPTVASPTSKKPEKAMAKSFLEPEGGMPQRVGSLRLPRLTAVLVHRSASLHAPKAEMDGVPFQRLQERRPGSFRRAISSLGAFARNIKRRSESGLSWGTETGDSGIQELNTHGQMQRSSSFNNKQTPRAPRLPRRADNFRFPSSDARSAPQV